jgi:hypothetical protein
MKVKFGKYLDTIALEKSLLAYLSQSRRPEVELVVFDLREVEWCELFELSLLTVWIADLRRLGKKVEFFYPLCELATDQKDRVASESIRRRQNVCSYLNRWDFDGFLRNQGIRIVGHDQNYPYWPPNAEQDSILPITFFEHEKDFKSFLSNLADARQLQLLFRDTVSLAVIGSGGIRDIIMREIGQNLYDHAAGRCAFLTIGTLPPLSDRVNIAVRSQVSTEIERPFFQNLGKSGYLQIVICDNGPGIAGTLVDTYSSDIRVPQDQRVSPAESSVIDYAFEFDTTSKTKEALHFEDDHEEDPGRGLYWVKEVVFQNRGLLCVRSGSSILAYDFLTSGDRHHFRSNKDDARLRRLANLGGTQLKIYFPLNPELTRPRERVGSLAAPAGRPGVRAEKPYKVLELKNYFPNEMEMKGRDFSELINDLPHPSALSGSPYAVFLDFTDTTWEKDNLVPLLIRVAALQHEGLLVVLVNTGHISQILQIASDVLAKRIAALPLKLKPILSLKGARFEILGLAAEDLEIVERSIASEQPRAAADDSTCEMLANRINNLFDFSPRDRRLRFKFEISELRRCLSAYYKSQLQAFILNESNGIYHSGRFLLPSNSYVEGYFRINTLLSSDVYKQFVFFVLLDSILRMDKPPAYLVTTSSDVSEIIDEALRALRELPSFHSTVHILLEDARDLDSSARQLFKSAGTTIVLINSVVGTAATVNSVLEVCRDPRYDVTVDKIFSVVDARSTKARRAGRMTGDQEPIEYHGKNYPFEAILSVPLNFYSERPQHWRREDIRRIDPVTNAPDPTPLEPANRPLWTPVDDFFLGNVISNANALHVGHYTRRHRHYTYFIDMERIADNVGHEIAAKIKKDMRETSSLDPSQQLDVTHVVYDGHSRGARTVADQIANEFAPCKSHSNQSLNVEAPLMKGTMKDVVLFVNAVASGGKLQRLVHSIAEYKPRRIFCYALINRRESDSVPFYQNIYSYLAIEIRIRYFVELEIPAYSVWDCPACNRRREVRELRDSCDEPALREFFDAQGKALEPTAVAQLGGVDSSADLSIGELVDQAILRRKLGEAKTSLAPRFELTKTIQGFRRNPDETLRLLEVMERDMGVLATYKELFYPKFCEHTRDACLGLLQNPVDHRHRERFAISVLRRLSPDSFVNEFVPVFKALSKNPRLFTNLFAEVLWLIKDIAQDDTSSDVKEELRANIVEGLRLCQQVIEEDSSFLGLVVDEVASVQHLLNYVRRKLRLERYRAEVSNEPWKVVASLWDAFADQQGRVHPKLFQDFPLVLPFSAENFRGSYAAYYDGPGKLADCVERVLPLFEVFASCLRPEIRNDLTYFLSRREGTFAGDFKVLDDSLRTLATLDSQHRLTDEEFRSIFYRNSLVNSAIDRLRNYAFIEDRCLIRRALKAKFTDIDQVIRESVQRWEHRFSQSGVRISYMGEASEAFGPESVICDVIDGLLQNIYRHAFDSSRSTKEARINLRYEVGTVVIETSDNGKGLLTLDTSAKPNGGIQRSKRLLAPYMGELILWPAEEAHSQGLSTVVEVRLFSKEKVLSWQRS